MTPVCILLAALALGSAVLTRRFAWAAVLNMLAGAALVLALLAAGTSAQGLILAALGLCAVTLLCGRGAA